MMTHAVAAMTVPLLTLIAVLVTMACRYYRVRVVVPAHMRRA